MEFVRLFRVTGALVALTTLGLTAHAQTLVYNNGTFSPTDGLGITSQAVADDLVFGSSQTFNLGRIWVSDDVAPNNTLNGFSGTLSWLIRSDNAGEPGAVLSSGTVSGAAITQTDTGSDVFGFRVFQLDFPITSTTLGAGTYWFQVKENGLTDPDDGSEVFWAESASATGFDTYFSSDPVTPVVWSSGSTQNRAFQLLLSSGGTSAPEPGTLALLALGMAGGLVARRRK